MTATGGASTQTNISGYYALGSLSPGVYDITFTKSGYQEVTVSNVVIRSGESSVLNMELTVPGHLTITTTTLPPADTGNQYNPRVKISGGVYPYAYTIAYGALPPGLTLDPATGNITGTPTTPGAYTFAIGVTDKLNNYAESEFTIEITAPLMITTENLPRGTKGVVYQQSIAATGGTQPYIFSLSSGTLPSNLNVSCDGSFAYGISALAIAVDNNCVPFTTGGNATWLVDTSNYYSGNSSAKSGTIGNSQSTWMEATVTGPTTLSFWRKVSSEANYDFLSFSIDGIVQTEKNQGQLPGNKRVIQSQPERIQLGGPIVKIPVHPPGRIVVGWTK